MTNWRGYKCRIYPTREQLARLGVWEDGLRSIWNAALEQRHMYLARGQRMPSAFDQIKQLTPLRAEIEWARAIPRSIAAQMLINLDRAWHAYFNRLARRPRWKRKNRDRINVSETGHERFRIAEGGIVFPGLGFVAAVFHRPLAGRVRFCTIAHEVDQWFAAIHCEREILDPKPRPAPAVALDRGVTNLVADSDGRIIVNPKHLDRSLKRLARAQRVVARRKKGSKRRSRAALRVAKIHRKIRRQRQHLLHVLSAAYAKSHGVVVVEKLNVRGMVRGNLGREISGAGWSMFKDMLRYKLEATGGTLVEVPAAYSSQTCSRCGVVDAASRDRERFRCVGCGHEAHADVNAAIVLLSRRTDGGAGRGGQGAVRPPAKRQLRVVRRGRLAKGVAPNRALTRGLAGVTQ